MGNTITTSRHFCWNKWTLCKLANYMRTKSNFSFLFQVIKRSWKDHHAPMEVSNRILVLQASAVSKITKTENKSQYSSFRILSLKKSTRENWIKNIRSSKCGAMILACLSQIGIIFHKRQREVSSFIYGCAGIKCHWFMSTLISHSNASWNCVLKDRSFPILFFFNWKRLKYCHANF